MSSAQEIFPTWMAKAHHFYPCLKETAQSFVSSTVLKRKESPAHRAAPHADTQTSRLASQCPHWPTRSACRAAHRTKRLCTRVYKNRWEPVRFRFESVPNRFKFKIQFFIQKNEKFLKILQDVTNITVSNFLKNSFV